jgi:hypothetical protein
MNASRKLLAKALSASDYATPHAWCVFTIGMMGGWWQEALAEVNRATSPPHRDLGPNHIFARRFDESNVVCIRARKIDPNIDAHSQVKECFIARIGVVRISARAVY